MALALNALPSYAEAFSAPASTSIFSNAPMPYTLDAVSRVPAPRMVIFPSLYRAFVFTFGKICENFLKKL